MSSFQSILGTTRLARAAATVAVLASVAACGQRGPLYLPAEPAAAGRATLPQVLSPVGTPTNPAPPGGSPATGRQGTGTATPVRPQ